MKQRSKYTLGITSIVLVGTLGLGAVASASDDGSGGRGGRARLTDEQKCEKQAAAEAAGETDKVAKIDKGLARLAKLSDRIDARLATFQTWVAENCA